MLNQLEPWLQFLERKDNIGLPLMEVKQKYLKEQIEFDDFISQQRSIIRGTAPKIEVVKDPKYTGLDRYKNFPRCGETPPVDFFPQNLGSEYVDGISGWNTADKSFELTFYDTVMPEVEGDKKLRITLPEWNVATSLGVPTIERIPEFQGRKDVIKITAPSQLALAFFKVQISFELPSSIDRYDYFNNYDWSLGLGFWADNFASSNSATQNYTFVGGGNSDLLDFLNSIGDPSSEPFGGTNVGWGADKWNDFRTINRRVTQGDGTLNTFYNFNVNQSNSYPLDPNLYGREFITYLSDFNFRVCPR
jgi:hypothetical protein